uniref:Uncharacterized protein n=1 Tax=Oryza brachyantha TaxID=4533 RepID=J3LW09_ORYBR
VGRHLGEATDALVVGDAPLHPDVPSLSPRRAPRVLHHPVLGPVARRAVADHSNGVVQLGGAAGGAGEDAALVELEVPVAAGDGHGNGLVRRGLEERGLVVGRHVLVASDGGGGGGPVGGGALVVARRVRVVGLRGEAAVVDDELEGVVHEPALAALVLALDVTGHQLLLRQRHQLP